MRILLPTDVFPPFCGGSGWSTYYLAKVLEKKGHEITIIVPKPNVKGVSFGKYNGLDIVYIGYKTSNIPLVKNYYKNEVFWKEMEIFLTHYLSQNKYDIIHAQHQMTIIPSIIVGNRLSIPVVSTIRDYWPVCYFGTMYHDDHGTDTCNCVSQKARIFGTFANIYVRKNLEYKRSILNKSTTVTCASNFMKDTLSSINIEAELVENFVDTKDLKKISKDSYGGLPKKYLFYGGNLTENKGVLFMLSSISGLKMPTLIAGSGMLENKMKAIIKENNLDAQMVGRLSYKNTIKVMSKAHALIFPSLWNEPFGRVIIESMALGVPVIALDRGGPRDIITNGKDGILTTKRSFASQLKRIIKDNKLRARFSKNAMNAVRRKYDEGKIVKKFENIYKNALRKNQRIA